jgi:hypothetical protein
VPELRRLEKEIPALADSYAQLETRVGKLLDRYHDYVCYLPLPLLDIQTEIVPQVNTVSEIFISWNAIVSSAEEEVARAERERNG